MYPQQSITPNESRKYSTRLPPSSRERTNRFTYLVFAKNTCSLCALQDREMSAFHVGNIGFQIRFGKPPEIGVTTAGVVVVVVVVVVDGPYGDHFSI